VNVALRSRSRSLGPSLARGARRALLAAALLVIVSPPAARSQTEGDLKRAEKQLQERFEGNYVKLLLDMPATAQGVDITPDAEKPLAFPDYQARLKKAGTAIKRGESAMVTKVKVKSKLIEFQLGGGGYGTFFDEKASGGGGVAAGKSTREKNLERDLKKEKDPAKRRAMSEELDRLRRDRRQDERETAAESRQAEALDKARLEEKALSAGSRFNIRYPDGVTTDAMTADAVMSALAKYVDFEESGGGAAGPDVSSPAPGDGVAGASGGPADSGKRALRKGATLAEVASLYGAAVSSTRRTDGEWNVTINRYRQGTQRLEATFIEGVLVRYTLSEE
jgi:hypothetical protein